MQQQMVALSTLVKTDMKEFSIITETQLKFQWKSGLKCWTSDGRTQMFSSNFCLHLFKICFIRISPCHKTL